MPSPRLSGLSSARLRCGDRSLLKARNSSTGGSPGSVEVHIRPKNSEASRWLASNFAEVRRVFLEIHKPTPPEVGKHHPHEIYLEKHLEESPPYSQEPDLELYYAWTGGHWSKQHASQTVADMKETIRRLGADATEFKLSFD